jgi:hypothetical protein
MAEKNTQLSLELWDEEHPVLPEGEEDEDGSGDPEQGEHDSTVVPE